MKLNPSISFEQYREACKATLLSKAGKTQKRDWRNAVFIAILGLSLGVLVQLPAARVPALTVFALMVLCWLIAKPLTRYCQDKCFRRIFEEEQESLNNQTLTINETGIICEARNGQISSHHDWLAFIKRIDLADAYIFLPSPNSFIRLPKEQLSQNDLELIQRWSSIVPNPTHS